MVFLHSELAQYICSLIVAMIYVSIFTCMDQVLSNCEVSFPDADLISSRASHTKININFCFFFSISDITSLEFSIL